MTDSEQSLRDRAQEMDEDWIDRLADASDGGGGCMELAETLSELREE